MGVNSIQEATFVEVAPAAVRTTTFTGAAVALTDYANDFMLTQISAQMTTGDTLDGKIQDSPDGSTGWADLTGATFAQVTDAADAFETIKINANTTRGWIRYVGTIAGASPSVAFGVVGAGFKFQR